MISDKEVKEAVEVLDKQLAGAQAIDVRSVETLISLAQSYLSAEMPEDTYCQAITVGGGKCDEKTCLSFNSGNCPHRALHLIKLASLKDKARIEELEKKVRERMDEIIEESQKVMALQVERARLEEALREVVEAKKAVEGNPEMLLSHHHSKEVTDICVALMDRYEQSFVKAKSALANVKQGREHEKS